MVHINMPCLNLGTCSVLCVWMYLNLGISSILKQNNANLQAFIDKFRQRAKYLQDFYLTFCILLKILRKISKIMQKRNYRLDYTLLVNLCSLSYATNDNYTTMP